MNTTPSAMPPAPRSSRWERFSHATATGFRRYAEWLVSISWKKFFLLSILLLIATAILRRLTIEGDSIVLDVVQAGPKEPMCCGTQLARKTYKLVSGQLRQAASQAIGRLSLAAVSRLEWVLEEMNGRRVVQATQPPTFTVQGDTASGFTGCNRFSGAINETSPGKISLGDLAGAMLDCADAQMLLEDQYLGALRRVDSYTFLAGRLALSWERGDERGVLVFRRR